MVSATGTLRDYDSSGQKKPFQIYLIQQEPTLLCNIWSAGLQLTHNVAPLVSMHRISPWPAHLLACPFTMWRSKHGSCSVPYSAFQNASFPLPRGLHGTECYGETKGKLDHATVEENVLRRCATFLFHFTVTTLFACFV